MAQRTEQNYRRGGYVHGSAAPAEQMHQTYAPELVPVPKPQLKATPKRQNTHGISVITVLGSIIVAGLLILVLVAHINYIEITRETSRVNAELRELTQQRRRLEIQYESVIDMQEVERFARDVLGMTQPGGHMETVVLGAVQDRAVIIQNNQNDDRLADFGRFISSLLDRFR